MFPSTKSAPGLQGSAKDTQFPLLRLQDMVVCHLGMLGSDPWYDFDQAESPKDEGM